MNAYWRFVNDVWIDTPEYVGGWFGQMRRFTSPRLKRMRELMTVAAGTAWTDEQQKRIALATESLSPLEESMAIREDFANSNFAHLDKTAEDYKAPIAELERIS